ncbi:MAG: DUF4124 domain-containing protein [Rhodanobacter sp.]
MRKLLCFVATTALLASLSVYAQSNGSVRYKWHDSHGLMHFSDSLTAEAMQSGYDMVNDRGMVVRHVDRQLNAQERAAAAKVAAEQLVVQHANEDKQRAEAQMLTAYPDEAAFKLSQQQALESQDQQIHTTKINLRSQEQALTDLLARAADHERDKKPVPKPLADGIAKQRNVVTGQRSTLNRQQAVRAQTVQDQTKQLARYRELSAQNAQSGK